MIWAIEGSNQEQIYLMSFRKHKFLCKIVNFMVSLNMANMVSLAGLHWCHDAWLWHGEAAVLWAPGFHEKAQLFFDWRLQRVQFLTLLWPKACLRFDFGISLTCTCRWRLFLACFISGPPFHTSRPTQTWFFGNKKPLDRGKPWRRACSLTKNGQVMALWRRLRAWFPTNCSDKWGHLLMQLPFPELKGFLENITTTIMCFCWL